MTKPNIPEFSTIEEILEYAMNEERDAYDYYLTAAERIADPEMKKFLLHLAEMEIDHYKVLKRKLEEYQANCFSSKGIMSSFHEDM